jgi:hypothetical protein
MLVGRKTVQSFIVSTDTTVSDCMADTAACPGPNGKEAQPTNPAEIANRIIKIPKDNLFNSIRMMPSF